MYALNFEFGYPRKIMWFLITFNVATSRRKCGMFSTVIYVISES